MNKTLSLTALLLLFIQLPQIAFAQPANDNACDAIAIVVNDPATTLDNTGATAQTDEVSPPQTGIGDPCALTWCGQEPEVQNSIWFTFVAPETGAVIINTCLEGNEIDTQIAVWQATDCNDFETYSFVLANDDIQTACNDGSEFSSYLFLDGLTSGQTYYLQLDGYDGEEGSISVEILGAIPTSRVNIIHNSADAAVSIVDIRVNGELVADDIAYQTCTGYIELPAGFESYITINPADSEDDLSPLASMNFTLNAAFDYVATITGIQSTEGYTPTQPFTIAFYEGAQLFSEAEGTVNVLFYHGVTDAPAVDIVNAETDEALVNDLEYGNYNTNGYVVSNGDTFSLMVTDEDGNDIGLNYCVPLNGVSDFELAFTVVVSGFLTPSNNSDGTPASVYFVNHFDGTFQELQSGLCAFPDNDDICDAMTLTVNAAPVTVDNTLASTQENEPSINNLGQNDPESDCLFAWCDGSLDNTLWFNFVAPASGAVTVSTCFETTIDTQVSLCEVGNCSDFGSVTFLFGNDDMEGGCSTGSEFASQFVATDLTPGNTYYLHADGWEGETGEFQIQVLEFIVNIDESTTEQLKLYPNPAQNNITIQGVAANTLIEVRDMQGKLIHSEKLSNNNQVSIAHLADGVYTISAKSDQVILTEKLIKQ